MLDPGAPGPLAELIESSLSVLSSEQPQRYRALHSALYGRVLAVQTARERFAIEFGESGARIGAIAAPAAVTLAFEPALVADLVLGKTTLLDALYGDQLVAVGELGALVAAHDGLMSYLHGAVRSPSFPGLWRRFQREFAPQQEPHEGT